MNQVIYDTLTLKQFLRLPEARPALEYIDGMVVQKVSPRALHSVIQTHLGGDLLDFAKQRRLGLPDIKLRCTYDGRSLVADISVFQRGRLPRDSQGRIEDDVFLAPDLAIEILSPGQTVKNLSARLSWCVGHGVRLGWLIQPRQERVLVFRPDEPVRTLEPGDTLSGLDVVPGYALPLTELFGWLNEG